MVTAHLNGKIGEHEYKMLIDSGSELNIMTLSQAQELALLIDDSGNSWTLKGISGHMMGLEGICWNIPVRIGGIEFSHNFFVTRTDLGNKDMVLVSQLATGGVTCHACHGCVTDFRPILGNPVEVTHVTSLGHVYIFPC